MLIGMNRRDVHPSQEGLQKPAGIDAIEGFD
jgi:hypothetical protein